MFTGNSNVSTKKISKSRLNCFGYWLYFLPNSPPLIPSVKQFVHKVVYDNLGEMSLWWAGVFWLDINHLTSGNRSFQLFPVSTALLGAPASTSCGSCKLSTHWLGKYICASDSFLFSLWARGHGLGGPLWKVGGCTLQPLDRIRGLGGGIKGIRGNMFGIWTFCEDWVFPMGWDFIFMEMN